jgi:3-oxoacyl-[acyl-carrier protein] reductase
VNINDLTGKIAIVTGGSNGIGAATVRMLAEAGASVNVGYNKGAERAEKLIASLPGKGHRAVNIVLEDSSTMQRLAEEIGKAHSRLDILVNSAGFTKPISHKNLDAVDDAFFDAMMVANVRGPFAMIRTFAPLLKASRNGTVVNVSSISGFTGSGSSLVYCAAKAALDTMTISLARVLGPEIRVLCASPGAVETDFGGGAVRDNAQLNAAIAAQTALGRVGQPDDIGSVVAALLASDTAWVNGQRIEVTGGFML